MTDGLSPEPLTLITFAALPLIENSTKGPSKTVCAGCKPAITMIRGPGALRRHAWDHRKERTLCGRNVNPNRSKVPGQLGFITCQEARIHAQGELHVPLEPVGPDIFDKLLAEAAVGPYWLAWSEPNKGSRPGVTFAAGRGWPAYLIIAVIVHE